MPTNNDQILVMNNERFTVPELLFRPDDLGWSSGPQKNFNRLSWSGLDQMGLAAAIAYSIGFLPEELQGLFWANIALIGGNAKFPNFRARLWDKH